MTVLVNVFFENSSYHSAPFELELRLAIGILQVQHSGVYVYVLYTFKFVKTILINIIFLLDRDYN